MRFFNQTFFKFTLGFLAIVAVSLLLIVATSAYATGVSRIVFTTDEQTIKPNTLSDTITIQTQDSSGNALPTLETMDLEFTSTSATGEFLGSTGNPVTKTMNKNTGNRTFYYRDSVEGNFTLNIKATGRDTGEVWTVSQKITVSSSDIASNTTGEVLSANTESASAQSTASGSSVPAYTYATPSSQLEVFAGSDRLTSPGSPIMLQALIKKNTASSGALNFSWSFGDGNVEEGALVSHTYKYPGDYAVVLNVRAGDVFSVSRLKVKVAESDIKVSDGGEYLEIVNDGNTEINLFNWKVENKGRGFVFQPNTIILPKSSIKLDKNLLTMKGLDNSMGTCLKNSLGKEVFVVAPVQEVDLSAISHNLEVIKKEALAIQSKIPSVKMGVKIGADLPNSPQPENLSLVATATENIIYEAPKSEGFMVKLTNFIKRVFSN